MSLEAIERVTQVEQNSQERKTAKDAEVKHLIIGHISERYGDKYEVLEEARAVFAHTILASDLNIINIY